MNIDNITSLALQLQGLGFNDIAYPLLKRISFKPDSFSISKYIEKGSDTLHVELLFEKLKDEYVLKCYDIAIQLKTSLQAMEINGIDITSFEKQMSLIDWKKAFELNEQKPWDLKSNFSNEEEIEAVITALSNLETSEDGKAVAGALKNKYWTGTNYYEIFGLLTVPKLKAEICQRFFIFNGQPGISIDEAYRFLQNRRMEKQLKRKQTDDSKNESNEGDDSGSSLLKKKRITGTTKKGKHKATIQ